jgi:MFS family permease
MVPLRIFRSGAVSGSNAVQALLTAGFFSFFFLGSLDFERVLGYGPLSIGLAFLPVAVVMGGFSVRFTAPLVMRYGAFAVTLAGQVVIGAALLLLGLGPVHGDYLANLLLPMLMLGLGGGLTFPALTMLAMSGAAPAETGLASGLLNTTGQVGGALGLAVLAAFTRPGWPPPPSSGSPSSSPRRHFARRRQRPQMTRSSPRRPDSGSRRHTLHGASRLRAVTRALQLLRLRRIGRDCCSYQSTCRVSTSMPPVSRPPARCAARSRNVVHM